MGRRRVKKTVRQASKSPWGDLDGVEVKGHHEKQEAQFTDPDVGNKAVFELCAEFMKDQVERQIAAIRAMRDVEIEQLLTELYLLRSYFNKEQLQTPILQIFGENLPNLSVLRRGENKQIEVQWNSKDQNISMNDAKEIQASLLHRLSTVYSNYSAAVPSLGGFEFSGKAVKSRLLGADNLQIKDFVLEEPSETQILGMQDALQTPGVTSQRLSFGMTPKTLRLPKPGEMLLSVHGSPLGVYKEENMEAIHESEEG